MYEVKGDEVANKVSRVGLNSATWNGSTLNLRFLDGTAIEIGAILKTEKEEGEDEGGEPEASLLFMSIPNLKSNLVTEQY